MTRTRFVNSTTQRLIVYSGNAGILVCVEGDIAPGGHLSVEFERGQTLGQYRVEGADGTSGITFPLSRLITFRVISIVTTPEAIDWEGTEPRVPREHKSLFKRIKQLFRF